MLSRSERCPVQALSTSEPQGRSFPRRASGGREPRMMGLGKKWKITVGSYRLSFVTRNIFFLYPCQPNHAMTLVVALPACLPSKAGSGVEDSSTSQAATSLLLATGSLLRSLSSQLLMAAEFRGAPQQLANCRAPTQG